MTMTKLFIGTILIGLFFTACTSKTSNVEVHGELKNVSANEIYFIPSGDAGRIDTVPVKNGKFVYSSVLQEPTVFMLNFGPEIQPGIAIFENGKASLQFDGSQLHSLEVHAGKDQEEYNRFLRLCRPLFKQIDSLGNLAQQQEEDHAYMEILQGKYAELDASLKKVQSNFLTASKSSIAKAFIARNYFEEMQDKPIQEIRSLYNSLEMATQKSYYGKKLQAMITLAESTSIGAMASDFNLQTPQGNSISLSSLKGKVVLLDFWASWCAPCRAANPDLVNAYKTFHAKGFEILAVSLDKEKQAWEEAIRKDGLTWMHVSDLKGWTSTVAELYGIQSIPSNFLLDANGKIVAKQLDGMQLEKKLLEVLK